MNRQDEQWHKIYRGSVRDFDKDFKKNVRIQYLEEQRKRYSRYIKRQQVLLDELAEKNSKWIVEMFKQMKDCLVVIKNSFGENAYLMPGNNAMFQGMGGYIKEKRPLNPKSVVCGTNYYEKIKKLKAIIGELNVLKGKSKHVFGDLSEAIRQAKQVPISNFIEVSKGNAICPAHDDKHPSLKIYEETNTCNCWSCQFNSDVIGLVQKIHNIGFKDALKLILNK